MFLSLLENRRSIRTFQDKPLTEDEVEALTEALLRAPSSRGLNPWEFILVTDPELLSQLGRAKEHGSGFLAGAPLAVAVAADPKRCDVWIEDCSIAAIVVQLAAESLGLGSCWSQIRCRKHGDGRSADEYVSELLGLPSGFVVEAVIGIGHPAEAKPPHARESLPQHKVHRDRFGCT